VLTNLNLEHNRIGDCGATAMAEALKTNLVLSSLWLADNSISVIRAEILMRELRSSLTVEVFRA